MRTNPTNSSRRKYTLSERLKKLFVVVDDELYRRVPDTKFKNSRIAIKDKELPGIKVQEKAKV